MNLRRYAAVVLLLIFFVSPNAIFAQQTQPAAQPPVNLTASTCTRSQRSDRDASRMKDESLAGDGRP